TSACGNTYFYCENIGHAPAYIKTSRLNDGVCDPECCDGTDEFDDITHCPNTCVKTAAEAKKERERVRRVEKEGGKIRQRYITYGKDAKQKLQELLGNLQKKMEQLKQDVADTKDKLDKVNAKHQEYLESSRVEREEARNRQLEPFIEQYKERLVRTLGDKHLFRKTLDVLKENHNKNYHDLAVKDTISGYDEYLKEVEQETTAEVELDKDEDKDLPAERRIVLLQSKLYDVRKDIGRIFQLLKVMKKGFNTEYNDEAVLKAIKVFDDFAHLWRDHQDEYVAEEAIQLPEEDTPAMTAPGKPPSSSTSRSLYWQAREMAKSVGLGFLFKEEKSELVRAQEAYDKASEEERKVQREIEDTERKLGMDYGKDETFAQLVDECLDYKDVEYTYTLCLFGSAKQESHFDTALGKFSSWVGDNYDTQLYSGGAKCWNGPERSVKVVMSCGAKNEIVAVSEPNKCEYLFNFRTPALCRIPSELKDDDIDAITEVHIPGTTPESRATKKHDEL
ncbi:hypothetical protein BGZ65_002680, partial [Modicella reniformis]